MVEAAKARGLKYIAITDHSKRVSMANGLDAAGCGPTGRRSTRCPKTSRGSKSCRGVECDILEDATLDLADDVLAEADWVIAVLHYGLKQPREQIMKRLMTAISNPHVRVHRASDGPPARRNGRGPRWRLTRSSRRPPTTA